MIEMHFVSGFTIKADFIYQINPVAMNKESPYQKGTSISVRG